MSYNQPNSFNQPQMNQNVHKNQVTGKEKIEIKSTPLGTEVHGKSSYNDPVTGVSETAKISTDNQPRMRDRLRDRSRSSSSERRRNMDRMPMRAQETAENTQNVKHGNDFLLNSENYGQQPYNPNLAPGQQYADPNINRNVGGQNWQNQRTMGNQGNLGTQGNQGMYGNQGHQGMQGTMGQQNMHGNLGQHNTMGQQKGGIIGTTSTQGTMSHQNTQGYQGNMGNQGMQGNMGYQNQRGVEGYEKDRIVQTKHGVVTDHREQFVDPMTGNRENLKVRTNVQGINTGGQEMHSYEKKINNTTNGPEVELKERHREGGVLTNLKNKINNMMH